MARDTTRRWYEIHTTRFESEYHELERHGVTISITDGGYGDVVGYLESSWGSVDVAILFPRDYPGSPPRIYLPQESGRQPFCLADGAVDLEAVGLNWTPQRTAWEAIEAVLRHSPRRDERGDLTLHGLTLRNLTAWVSQQEDLGLGGREKELAMMQECLIRQENAGLVLLGKAGVGKTSLVMQLAHLCAAGRVPAPLKSVPIYELRLEDLVASARYVGDAEREIGQLRAHGGGSVLFLDEIHRLASPPLDTLANAIKPEMASGKLRVIGASTDNEWRQIKDEGLKRRLVPIHIQEPSPRATYDLIRSRISRLQRHYGMEFPDEVVRLAIALAHTYLPDKAFPSKAIDMLDRAAAAQIVSEQRVPAE